MAGNRLRAPSVTLIPVTAAERERLWAAQETLGVPASAMLALAGWQSACFVRRWLSRDTTDVPLLLLAGPGRTGAVGLMAGRHWHSWGAEIQVLLSVPPEHLHAEARQALQPLLAVGVPVTPLESGWELPAADLLIDALLGSGERSGPRGDSAQLIRLANSHPAEIISLDLPSGLHANRAVLPIQAAATLAFGWPLDILASPAGQNAAGEVYLADIGMLPDAWHGADLPHGIQRTPFAEAELLRWRSAPA